MTIWSSSWMTIQVFTTRPPMFSAAAHIAHTSLCITSMTVLILIRKIRQPVHVALFSVTWNYSYAIKWLPCRVPSLWFTLLVPMTKVSQWLGFPTAAKVHGHFSINRRIAISGSLPILHPLLHTPLGTWFPMFTMTFVCVPFALPLKAVNGPIPQHTRHVHLSAFLISRILKMKLLTSCLLAG